jgi:hypothetical protein
MLADYIIDFEHFNYKGQNPTTQKKIAIKCQNYTAGQGIYA